MDASDSRHKGVLTGDDLAGFAASVEPPLTFDYHGWTVAKTGPWGQGPVLMQSLALLQGFGPAGLDPAGADVIHLVVPAMHLDSDQREISYGDPKFTQAPIQHWQ